MTTHTQILKSKFKRKFKISTVLIISLEKGAIVINSLWYVGSGPQHLMLNLNFGMYGTCSLAHVSIW